VKTYVSYNGYLQKIQAVYNYYNKPANMEFISHGRLVNPKGNYADAPYVSLYRMHDNNYRSFFVAVY